MRKMPDGFSRRRLIGSGPVVASWRRRMRVDSGEILAIMAECLAVRSELVSMDDLPLADFLLLPA